MIIQPIVDIAEVCARHGVTQAVICPGSRSAALTLAFSRHPVIKTYVIPDERSAGYLAMGLAQSSNRTVVIITTSGTAAANLYPAIIEAFYQGIPLLVLTADRPPEWIDQQDGQSIRQNNLYQNHILASYQFPVSFEHEEAVWHANRLVNEAILKSQGEHQGPVHINVPIREPFYPKPNEKWQYSGDVRIISKMVSEKRPSESLVDELASSLAQSKKVMLVIGQIQLSETLLELLTVMQKKHFWVIIGDIISNIHLLPEAISTHDLILLDHDKQEDLAPDLLITIGHSMLSKSLKGFLRRYQPIAHWHIGEEQEVVDTYRCLTKKIIFSSDNLFGVLSGVKEGNIPAQKAFLEKWQIAQSGVADTFSGFLNHLDDGEFKALSMLMNHLPEHCDLHLANSMAVRYASYLGLNNKTERVWSNRGASGIDGCTSTAVGHAINSDKMHVLITGDLAFFYDRNALWHEHVPDNLKIILINNHGGGIFRLIDGPKQQPELEKYFETRQPLTAANTAKDFGLTYFSTSTISTLAVLLDDFFSPDSGKAILEIETNPEINQKVFGDFKKRFRNL